MTPSNLPETRLAPQPMHSPSRPPHPLSPLVRLQRALAMLALATLGLTGCALSPSTPGTLLTLPAAAPASPAAATAPAPGADDSRVLVVRRVQLPEYLLTRRVRYRAGPSTVAEWPDTHWAERIEVAVTREFSEALRRALPGWLICEAQCAAGQPALSLQVEFGALDYLRPERSLEARTAVSVVTLAAPSRRLLGAQLQQRLPLATDTPQAHAAAISALLAGLADEVAARLR